MQIGSRRRPHWKFFQGEVRVPQDADEYVVEIVRDSASQDPEAFEFLRLLYL